MKVIFKNKTKYSKAVYQQFLEFHQETYGVMYHTYTMAIILALLFCIILQFQSRNYEIALITLAIEIAFITWRFKHPVTTVEKEMQSPKIENEQEFIFKFFEKCFTIYSRKLNRQLYYWQLRKIFETEDFFYLYIDRTHAFLLDKKQFEIGTSDAFRAFISRKCKFRFSSKGN